MSKKIDPVIPETIECCLDEIETAQEILEFKTTSDTVRKIMESWIRHQKEILKSLDYKGKIPRKIKKK